MSGEPPEQSSTVRTCQHTEFENGKPVKGTTCPPADAIDADAAKVVKRYPGIVSYSELCNGRKLFEDTGELMPGDKEIIPPHRGPAKHALAH